MSCTRQTRSTPDCDFLAHGTVYISIDAELKNRSKGRQQWPSQMLRPHQMRRRRTWRGWKKALTTCWPALKRFLITYSFPTGAARAQVSCCPSRALLSHDRHLLAQVVINCTVLILNQCARLTGADSIRGLPDWMHQKAIPTLLHRVSAPRYHWKCRTHSCTPKSQVSACWYHFRLCENALMPNVHKDAQYCAQATSLRLLV